MQNRRRHTHFKLIKTKRRNKSKKPRINEIKVINFLFSFSFFILFDLLFFQLTRGRGNSQIKKNIRIVGGLQNNKISVERKENRGRAGFSGN
jgi:hypothetical protein